MLRTWVVAAGLLYGEGEQLFHRFFKVCFVNESHLTDPCLPSLRG
jgi:hypothetical protein